MPIFRWEEEKSRVNKRARIMELSILIKSFFFVNANSAEERARASFLRIKYFTIFSHKCFRSLCNSAEVGGFQAFFALHSAELGACASHGNDEGKSLDCSGYMRARGKLTKPDSRWQN